MYLLNPQQLRALDAATLRAEDITSLDLMERAAREMLRYFLAHHPDRQRPIIVFAGPGNNGGDGLALARLLSGEGYADLSVYLFNTKNALSPDCGTNAQRLREECPDVPLTEIQQQFETPTFRPGTLIIDALFGIGLSKPLTGGYAALVVLINAAQLEVVSLDMPSGLMAEDNTLNSPSAIVRATTTLTIGHPKLALLLDDCQDYCGTVRLLDIGLTREPLGEMQLPYRISEHAEIRPLLGQRPPHGHKGTFGHALLVAGSYGMAGAAILSARACLRSGVGKLTVHTPPCNNDILQVAVPEAVLHHDSDPRITTAAVPADPFSAVAVGPGIGTDPRTALALIEQARHTVVPLLLDADAINILGSHKGWMPQVPRGTIFTPHPGEMRRLGNRRDDSYSLLLEAIETARRGAFFVILKGHRTAICTPSGQVYFNPTGNSGLATAGSGDVLTGILLALLAQGYEREAACRLGVYLHGLAGDIAARTLGEHSLTAHDIVQYLPQAFLQLEK